MENLFETAIEVLKEPYEKFESGEVPFFDKSSSAEKGRFRVRDARNFDPSSMRRKDDVGSVDKGVMLLVGKKGAGEPDASEMAITILFDKGDWDEERAEGWWKQNRHRFLGGGAWNSGGNMVNPNN